ncbi:cation:proton antiporter [Actinoplanes regularis]|uniref:Kef-type K+ transport system, membrane component KefB n=1 Tax=Actinoplanes regularis TaxID=52697 RepID=A0A239IPX0_9ACTN|nr:cation:proton antiporter [Actinoplanes regularis]GIE91478.1 cation:proton antiporter [Actinoplanes regularis]SNS95826.1 Kef-type K+ transport system, membrane component KefB [Actinoplanes regularis]
MTPTELAPRFFIAVAVIILFCRLITWLLAKVGQPPVVSEMLAGVMLGPSLLGLFFPQVQEALFPAPLLPILYVVGQIGLVLFMFQTGYAFKSHKVTNLVGTAGAVSLAGVTVPLLFGVLLVLATAGVVPIRVDGVSIGVTAAFVGVALAITAFPMLARIITERGIAGTRHGSLSLASGAVDDGVAWIMLAVVLAFGSGEAGPAFVTAGGTVLFGLVLWLAGPRVTGALIRTDRLDERGRMLAVVALLFLIAFYTDEIGLYAVFGAFALGVVMPRHERTDRVIGRVGPVASAVFLPLFFTFSGLRTEFGLFGDPRVLSFAAACVALAIAGKFGACWAAARLRGEPSGVALRVGALMNARGLMQLIALNVGLEAGIVNASLFTVLVLVALVTTLMTTPLLSWLDRRERRAPAPVEEPALVAS